MAARVYLETTVVSYLTAWPSRDIIREAHQRITRDWWDNRRIEFECYVSQTVIDEAAAGDPAAVAERMAALDAIPLLDLSEEAVDFAEQLRFQLQIPERAVADALHIAVAAANGMEYLLTWNCRHIANAVFRPVIEQACKRQGYEPPIICTPEQLMGDAMQGEGIDGTR
jgi:hypothetical protein